MRHSRVLVIDDDPIQLNTLVSLLRLRVPHIEIETAGSALAALERIRSSAFTVVICDAHQPRLEGIGFVRAVRRTHPQCPVLLVLEKKDEDLMRQAMNAGAYDVLVNPVEEGALLFALRRALEAAELRTQLPREQERFVSAVREMMRDLEALYGAHGLQAHFEAFMAHIEAEKTKNSSGIDA